MFSVAGELIRGTDYYGTQIRNPEDDYFQQAIQTILHGIKSYEPFWTRGARKAGESEGGVKETLQTEPQKIVAPYFGIMPAPRAYTTTATEKIMDEYAKNLGQSVKSPEEMEYYKEKRRAVDMIRQGKPEGYKELAQVGKKHNITEDKFKKWVAQAETDPRTAAR